MELHFNDIPTPRPISVVILCITWGLHILSQMNHSEINLWLATVAGTCAVTSYVITFIKWLKNKNK